MKVLNVKFKTKSEISKFIRYKNEIENLKKENSSMDVVSEIEDLTKDMIMQIYCSFNEEGLGPIKWWK